MVAPGLLQPQPRTGVQRELGGSSIIGLRLTLVFLSLIDDQLDA
jgi:hypothetical protein